MLKKPRTPWIRCLSLSGWLLTTSEASTEDKRNTHVWSLSHVSLFLLSGRGDVVKKPVLYPGDPGSNPGTDKIFLSNLDDSFKPITEEMARPLVYRLRKQWQRVFPLRADKARKLRTREGNNRVNPTLCQRISLKGMKKQASGLSTTLERSNSQSV